jgi:hypothetical protein
VLGNVSFKHYLVQSRQRKPLDIVQLPNIVVNIEGRVWQPEIRKILELWAVYTCDFPYKSPYDSVYDLMPKVSSKLIFDFICLKCVNILS